MVAREALSRFAERALVALRKVDRRLQLAPAGLSPATGLLATTTLAGGLALLLAGGCGPRTTMVHSQVGGAQPQTQTTGGDEPPEIAPPKPGGAGRGVRVTLYHLATQSCPDAAQVPLPKCGGGAIAQVSSAFRHSAAMQGSAKLCDGRVVGVKRVSPLCFAVVAEGFPWGVTSSGRGAEPFRSIAVDPKIFPLGKWFYVPELDGVPLPAPAEGKVHDGCVRADDTGSAVKGDTVDLFVGPRSAVDALKAKFSDVTIHLADDDGYCTSRGAF